MEYIILLYSTWSVAIQRLFFLGKEYFLLLYLEDFILVSQTEIKKWLSLHAMLISKQDEKFKR